MTPPYPSSGSALSLRTSDLDEVRSFLDPQYYHSVIRMAEPSQQLAARCDILRLGPVTVGDVRFGAELDVALRPLGSYHVNILRSGWLRWREHSTDPSSVAPGSAVVFQPTDTARDRWSSDSSFLAVKIEPAALLAELGRMLDAPVTSAVQLGSLLDTTRGPARMWARLVRLIASDAAVPDGLAGHPMLRDRLVEMLLGGLLLSTEHAYRDRLDQTGHRPVEPRPVRCAIDAMQAHPEWPFTLASLADIAGVSQRTLQEGFRCHVGTPPMRYLRDVRLDRAHENLRRREPTSTVTAVAYAWGFTHLGRFAGLYRARFGVAPSQHLRGDPPAHTADDAE